MIQKISEPTTKRKDMPEHRTNPSIPVAAHNTRVGTRRITNKAGDKAMIVSESTGEVLAPAGFHEVIQVDRTRFVKLYVDNFAGIIELSSPGIKVFQMVYKFVLNNPNTDRIYLSPKEIKGMAKATFERGLTELLSKEILYRSTIAYVFFLNINYMYNGDRLAVVKEYRLSAETIDGDVQEPLPL